jgi:hypothetical protein
MPHPTPVETLEPRKLMASVGPVVAQHFIGPQEAVTAVVLTFDVPLDPATAQNPGAYKLVRKSRESDDGPFGDGDSTTDADRVRVETANYDPVANAVTLTTRRAFELRKDFTVVQVQGNGASAVLTTAGTPIDGDGNGRAGGDLFLRYKARANRTLSFKDADGDRVRLRVEGGGHMLYFLPIRGRSSPAIFMRETNPTTSVLTGTVKQGRRGDGVIDIAQISAASTAQIQIQSDPAFRVRVVTP